MDCPRCKTSLVVKNIRGINASIEVETCGNCEGKWFTGGTLSKVEKIMEPTVFEIRRIPGLKSQLETLTCPHCNNGQILAKAESTRDKHVIMDYCPACHGIWLDKGELEAIQQENWIIILQKFYRWLKSPANS